MTYDTEIGKKLERDMITGFKAAFPLADERDLPRTGNQIKPFLKDRIDLEVKEGIRNFQSRVVRILCEVSEPKNHVEDMARIVVNEANKVHSLSEQLKRTAGDVRLLMGRLEWMSTRLKALSPEISEAIGLKKDWRNIFLAIDEAKAAEKALEKSEPEAAKEVAP